MEPTSAETSAQPSAPTRQECDEPTCDASAVSARPERNSLVPPYWRRHSRNSSRLSSYSSDGSRPMPIGLEDHTDESSEQYRVLWAKAVTVDSYIVISGTAPGLGAYVVWNCTVETLLGGSIKMRKRYSEFEHLRTRLMQTFPHAVGSMPQFPPKSVVCKSQARCLRCLTDPYPARFRPRFLEKRKQGLSFFLNCVLLNPEFAGSPVLKEFLFL